MTFWKQLKAHWGIKTKRGRYQRGTKQNKKRWRFQKVPFWAEGTFSFIPWSVEYT
jgi:hypothetical protein